MGIRRTGRGRRAACGAALAASALTLAACGSNGPATPPASSGEQGAQQGGARTATRPSDASPDRTTGVFLVPEIASNAFTYNVDLVPPNSTATVTVAAQGSQTTVSLNVYGLKPRRGYGAAAQTQPCAADPSASGHDYQNETDPDNAGPENELRLDFTTTGTGTAHPTRTVGWSFRPDEARSLVIFAHHTSTADDAGDAGARLACLDVDF